MKNTRYAPLTLIVPNLMGYLPVVLKTIEALCEGHGFDKATTTPILIACEEAMANVIQHAFLADEDAEFSLLIAPSPTGIAFHIRDKGMPYDPDHETFDEETLKGLGSFMIGKMMDQVQFHNLGNGGKELVLRKYFPLGITEQELQEAEVAMRQPTTLTAEQISYRRFQPEDALEIARCAYESYGYTYAYEHIYFPERIRELNASGDLISLVASFGDQVLGHIALVKFDGADGLYEVGLAMTKQGYRGLHIFSKLVALSMAEAQKRGVSALFVQCVTTHIYSQKPPLKMGMQPTALLCAYVPSDIDFRQIKQATGDRSAVMVVTKVFDKRGLVTIYVPQRHRALLSHIYNRLNQPVLFATASSTALLAETSLSINANLRMAKLFLRRDGADIGQLIQQHLQRVRKEGVQMVEAFVNIFQPDAPALIEAAERDGFVLVGLLPGAIAGDFAVLQYFNGVHVQTAAIELVPESAFLLQHIQEIINL